MKKPKVWQRLAAVGSAAALVFADQWFKCLAETKLANAAPKTLIPGILRLRYTQNTGVAFSALGEFPGVMLVISILTALVLAAALAALLIGKVRGAAPLCCVALILAGGLGNLIDRLSPQRYVVDYLEFLFVQFAVFNFADICITVGVVSLAIWILFFSEKDAKKGAA